MISGRRESQKEENRLWEQVLLDDTYVTVLEVGLNWVSLGQDQGIRGAGFLLEATGQDPFPAFSGFYEAPLACSQRAIPSLEPVLSPSRPAREDPVTTPTPLNNPGPFPQLTVLHRTICKAPVAIKNNPQRLRGFGSRHPPFRAGRASGGMLFCRHRTAETLHLEEP